jgi:thiosulfate dehydrogenase (quinone) large subunit
MGSMNPAHLLKIKQKSMEDVKKLNQYTNAQAWMLVVLRVLIGWHFLYEGIAKIVSPNWSSVGYLMDSQGWFAGIFQSIASHSSLVSAIDFLNIWGLTAIGLGLILGCLTQVATVAGILLLAFYYFSHPALMNANYVLPTEGNYLWVNKTLIELIALAVLFVFPTGKVIGFDRIIFGKHRDTSEK